jgi:hypothetical protein
MAPSRFRYNRGSTLSPGAMQFASGPDFSASVKGLMGNPAVRAGGWMLAGLPVALAGIQALNEDPDNPIGNLAGAGGSVGGGLLGGAAGMGLGAKLATAGAVAGGPFAPILAPLGFAAGSALGGYLGEGVTRGTANAVTGLTRNPLRRQIENAEELARSQYGMQNEALLASLPAMQALAAQQRQQEAEQADLALRTQLRSLYQQGMLGPSNVPVNGYATPGYGNALAQVAMGAFG